MFWIKHISNYVVPSVFLLILFGGIYKNVRVFDAFVEGARDGIRTTIRIIPSLVGLMVAIGVFRASGALDVTAYALKPLTLLAGIPPEVLPLALLRPISGSASLAVMTDIFRAYGTDSILGRMASVMMGSTETTFYTLTLYFGSVGVKKVKYTVLAALISDVVCIVLSSFICRIIFQS